MSVVYTTNLATSDNQVSALDTLSSILSQLTTINTGEGTENTQLTAVINQLALLATASGQASAQTTLAAILAALAPVATSANQALVLAALAPLSTAANQSVANTALAAIQSAIVDLDSKFGSANATLSNVAQSTSSQAVLPANAARKGYYLYNDTGQKAFIAFAATATSSAYTLLIPANSGYESAQTSPYKGVISIIWAGAGSGALRVTEMT